MTWQAIATGLWPHLKRHLRTSACRTKSASIQHQLRRARLRAGPSAHLARGGSTHQPGHLLLHSPLLNCCSSPGERSEGVRVDGFHGMLGGLMKIWLGRSGARAEPTHGAYLREVGSPVWAAPAWVAPPRHGRPSCSLLPTFFLPSFTSDAHNITKRSETGGGAF